MMVMMQHLIGENRRNNHNNDQDDRSIAGSQHRTQSGTADKPTHPTFRKETPTLTPNAMVENIVDELQQARNEWDSLPAYVQDGWTFDRYLNFRAARQKQADKHRELLHLEKTLSKFGLPKGSNSLPSSRVQIPQNKEEEVISMFKEYNTLPQRIKEELPFMSYMDLHPSLFHKTEFARKKYHTIAHK